MNWFRKMLSGWRVGKFGFGRGKIGVSPDGQMDEPAVDPFDPRFYLLAKCLSNAQTVAQDAIRGVVIHPLRIAAICQNYAELVSLLGFLRADYLRLLGQEEASQRVRYAEIQRVLDRLKKENDAPE
jgi:hypothetical protein